MLRRLLVVALVSALALVAGVTPAGVTAGPGAGPHEFAVGGATLDPEVCGGCDVHIAFSAHQRGTDAPTGHVVLWQRLSGEREQVAGPVTCLEVDGPIAAFVFKVTRSNVDDVPEGLYIFVQVTDLGNPVNGTPIDTLLVIDNPVMERVCDRLPDTAAPIESGNIVVRDDAALPCIPLTDEATYRVDEQCQLWIMTEAGWQLVQ